MTTTAASSETPYVGADAFRAAMACLASGVTVISTRCADGAPHGVTVSSFVSLSLEPPLVQWSLRRAAPSCGIFRAARYCAANILAEDQEALSRRFCAPIDRFGAIKTEQGMGGVPLLPGALSRIECEKIDEYPGGDHVIFLARVLRASGQEKQPLLHWRGGYHRIT